MDDGCEALRAHDNLSRSPLVTGDGREAVSAHDSGGWASLRKPLEDLPEMRRYWLADVVWRLDGFLGRRDVDRVS